MKQLSNKGEIFGLFPVPVVKFSVPSEYMNHVPSLKNRLIEKPDQMGSHIISENRYVLDNLEYKNLRNWILERVQEFNNEVQTIDQTALLTQSWINKNSPNEHTHIHVHPNSITSGVFYMDVPDGNAIIRFHRADHGGAGYFVMEPKYFEDDKHDYSYVSRMFTLKVNAGELILFPSWVIHSVPTNPTSFDRWSLAFNSMVENSIGTNKRLTEFIYPKL